MGLFRFFIILILIVLSKYNLFCQGKDSTINNSISAKYSYGYIYPHHASFNYFIEDYVQAIELNYKFRTNGNKTWHKLYQRPTVGLGYYYANLGNSKLLGNVNAIFPFISVPIIDANRLKLSYKAAAGLAWISKNFDLYNNNYNIAVGSHLNAYLNVNLDLDVRLTDKFHFLFGLGLTHYSNGGMKQPNKGLNVFSTQVGLLYQINEDAKPVDFEQLPKFVKNNDFSLIYSIGIKTLEPARTKVYLVSSLSLNAERQLSHKNRIGIGLDLFKDNSRIEYLVLVEDYENPKKSDLYYAGSHLSYDLVFGKTSFTIQMGAYFWHKSKHFQNVYHRFGVKYRFSEHWMANLTLKTFWAAADFAEWGIGYRF